MNSLIEHFRLIWEIKNCKHYFGERNVVNDLHLMKEF